ncbi:DUF4340 domain-containing protein [Paenibacillus agricola]|uniref:DUF4340 domain-containing protein n=1 Tax=Paenibacillus agricola TaxID=2716264 RepID=A0ABX0JFD9_9BACL|nr:DUF4340 domain-containing protein [Paenibacillus agricola]NHN33931.1 DUF4340 domain-containing protein [Paenibacillus agricola]
MKRFIPTLVLVVLCICGFWYASSQNFFKEQQPAAGPALVTVNKDEIASYTITTADGEIELQRKDGKWTMAKPSPLPLEDYVADGWVESFQAVSKDSTVDANAKDLAQFGLDKPIQQFKITLQSGVVHTLSIGNPVAIQGFHYAMFSGSPEVFQLSDSKAEPLLKTQLDFMDKNPVKLEYEQVRSMMVSWKEQKWTLTKVDADKKSFESDWKLGETTVKPADASAVLDKLQFLTTDQPAKGVAELKQEEPALRIEVKLVDASQKETTAVYVGRIDQDNVWLLKEGGEWAYAVPLASIQELADKGNLPMDGAEAPPAEAAPPAGTIPSAVPNAVQN